MKHRAGFVSNSSSSSFCILGVKMTPEIRKKLEKMAEEVYKADGRDLPEDEESSELAYACDLRFYNDDYGEIIGRNLEGLTPTEVVGVENELKEVFGDDLKFKVMSGDYYC